MPRIVSARVDHGGGAWNVTPSDSRILISSAQLIIARPAFLSSTQVVNRRRSTSDGVDGESSMQSFLLLVAHRQRHGKRRPFPHPLTFRAHAAAVQLHEVVHDREAEAEAGVEAGVADAGLAEALEHVGEEV